jgi:hypothetical protein
LDQRLTIRVPVLNGRRNPRRIRGSSSEGESDEVEVVSVQVQEPDEDENDELADEESDELYDGSQHEVSNYRLPLISF